MSLIQSRTFANTPAFRFLQRSVAAFENNADKIIARVQACHCKHAPRGAIYDALVTVVDGDEIYTARLFDRELLPAFEVELAATIGATFEAERQELEPSADKIGKIVGRNLGAKVYGLLSLDEKIRIVRAMPREEAQNFCKSKLARRKAYVDQASTLTFTSATVGKEAIA